MDEIPMEWVDKLFNCMALFYGNRWTKYFTKPHIEDFFKAVWKSGLQGLSHDEIRGALTVCKQLASDENTKPPNIMEFYFVAKGEHRPYVDCYPKISKVKCTPEVQQKNIDEIKRKLGMKAKLGLYQELGS